MTSAIARWHSNAPLWSSVECAYADKLEVEMQELGEKLTKAMQTIQETKAQVMNIRFSMLFFITFFHVPETCTTFTYPAISQPE